MSCKDCQCSRNDQSLSDSVSLIDISDKTESECTCSSCNPKKLPEQSQGCSCCRPRPTPGRSCRCCACNWCCSCCRCCSNSPRICKVPKGEAANTGAVKRQEVPANSCVSCAAKAAAANTCKSCAAKEEPQPPKKVCASCGCDKCA